MIAIIIFCFIPTLLAYDVLPQFGKIELKEQSLIILDLNGYSKGDNIYLELVIKNSFYQVLYTEEQFITSKTLNVWENNNITFNDETQQYITDYKYLKDGLDDFYFYYTIKLKGNYKYLLIITPKLPFEEYKSVDEFNPLRDEIEVYLKHNKNNYNSMDIVDYIFIIVLSIILVIALIVCGVIFYRIRIRKNRKSNILLDFKAGNPEQNNIAN